MPLLEASRRVQDPAIALRGVSRSFGDVQVLRGLDLVVARGERVIVRGASGSGKSTLLAIMGLIDPPDAGDVRHAGRDLALASEAERSRERLRGVGFVFQRFHLMPTLTALQNVALPAKAAGALDAQERAAELLARVGLSSRADHLPHELSGGQQQMVAVARAVVNKPYLVLADEPTGELDPDSGARVLALLQEATQRDGAALVMVTHAPEQAPPGARHLRLDGGALREVRA